MTGSTDAASLARLERLGPSTIALGLQRMERALAALGHPERRLGRVLHVAGTNGKGSTCAFAASILKASGWRVGLYTSPHLVTFNERLRIDGVPISDVKLAARIEEVFARLPGAFEGPEALTYFEMATLLACCHFAEEALDAVVLETGLGGRLDATRACVPDVTVITHIALDHRMYLGETLGAIAREKAGIFRPGVPAVVGAQPDEALAVLMEEARRVGAPLVQLPAAFGEARVSGDGLARLREPLQRAPLGLLGPHQRDNAALAGVACHLLREGAGGLGDRALRDGLRSTSWPGRFERIDGAPLIVLDGAHNPDGARCLAEALEAELPARPRQLIFGALADKDASEMLRALLPHVEQVFLVTPESPRALSATVVLERLRGEVSESALKRIRIAEPLAGALDQARGAAGPGGVVVIAGSLVLVGSAARRL